jgi:hypothetical protein
MSLLLDDGKSVRFGQDLTELERLFSCSAVDNPLRIARKSIDQVIRLNNVSLEFDSRRMRSVTFSDDYRYVYAPTPFRDPWRNLDAIGTFHIVSRMHRDEFLAYVARWEERAKEVNAKRVEFADLQNLEYAITINRDRFFDTVSISMGPSRRARGGGIWCDGWHAFFAVELKREGPSVYKGSLKSLSASCDEFNTVARPK